MVNVLGAYNPVFYASETLVHLRSVLGMAARVHRGYDLERRSFRRGQTIRIRKPGTFTAQDAPGNVQDVNTETTDIVLNNFKEVRFAIDHDQLAFTGEEIINDHIEPASYAIAKEIDDSLVGLYADIPWLTSYDGGAIDEDVMLGPQQVLFDNSVATDAPGMIHQMVDSSVQKEFLKLPIWNSQQVVGQAGSGPALRGTLGTRFNIEVFASQQVPSFIPGTLSGGGDVAGAVVGAHAVGATSLALGSLTDTQTIKAGDSFSIAGDTQRYAVTADTAVSTTSATVGIFPALKVAVSGSEVVTFNDFGDTNTRKQQLMFHRNAFAAGFAQLPMNMRGVEAFTATDPQSGLSVRAWRYTDGDNSREVMVVDALWGVKTLDPNMACRAYAA